MDYESLLTGSKWEILRLLAQKPHAPLEIAKTLNTTIANVSQQLRLLEAAGLVGKQKLGNFQAGKPRALYSIKANFAYTAVVAQGSANKKLVALGEKEVFFARVLALESHVITPLITAFVTRQDLFGEAREIFFISCTEKSILLRAVGLKPQKLAVEGFTISIVTQSSEQEVLLLARLK